MEGYLVFQLRRLVRKYVTIDLLKIIWFFGFFTIFFGPYFPMPGSSSIPMHAYITMQNLLLFTLIVIFKDFYPSNERMRWYYGFLLLWLVWSVLSISWAADKSSAAITNRNLFYQINIIVFTSLYFGRQKSFIHRFLNGMTVVFLCFTCVGLWEMITAKHLLHSAARYYPESIARSPTAFFHNPNDFAAMIAIYIPFLFAAFVLKSRRNWLHLLLIIISVLFVIQNKSRASFFALISGLGIWLLLTVAGTLMEKIRLKQSAKSVFVVGLVSILLLFFSMNTTVGIMRQHLPENMFEMKEDLKAISPQETENSSGTRKALILNGFLILRGRELTGVGAGNVETYMYPLKHNTGGMVNMHNWWMELLVCYGYPFAALFVLFYIAMILELLRIFWMEKEPAFLVTAMASAASMVSFFLASISPSSIKNFNAIWATYGITLGVILQYYMHEKEAEEVTEEEIESNGTKLSVENSGHIGPLSKQNE